MHDILHVTKLWLERFMYGFVVNEIKVNKNTAVDWFMFCWEVCMNVNVNDSVKIGEVNVVVVVDERKSGNMKYGSKVSAFFYYSS